MSDDFSTIEALETLCSQIPEWNTRLDDLNGQIDLRQIELARLEEIERPPTRSLRNKGSTESLRPYDQAHDVHENPFLAHDLEADDIPMNPFESQQNGYQRPGSAGAAREAMRTTPPPKVDSRTSSPRVLTRQASHPTPIAHQRPTVLRKRKTASLASTNTGVPKYRTRSMIIVYYDSAVQLAFEELVKFVSASRNAMRKGKMAVKMSEMKRAAEREVGDDVDGSNDEGTNNMVTNHGALMGAQKTMSITARLPASASPGMEVADSDSALDDDMKMPKLTFVSTRRMGPARDSQRTKRGDNAGGVMRVGMLKGYRREEGDTVDIFDQLDKSLEWCQGQCEHAAHQFLRDGECTTEIENIKRKLDEVREITQKEVEKMKKDEMGRFRVRTPKAVGEGKVRQLSIPTLRKEVSTKLESKLPKPLVVDDRMEIDDEGVDDMDDAAPKLTFQRTRDRARDLAL